MIWEQPLAPRFFWALNIVLFDLKVKKSVKWTVKKGFPITTSEVYTIPCLYLAMLYSMSSSTASNFPHSSDFVNETHDFISKIWKVHFVRSKEKCREIDFVYIPLFMALIIRAMFAYTMMRIKLSLRNADTTAFIYISFSDVYIIIYWTLGFEVNIRYVYVHVPIDDLMFIWVLLCYLRNL